ncbi:hypothetical protein RCZ01_17150 [Capnocytophaga felis]|uniref:Uncharacterized protein n=1 Tax=Capnocytophaga felis TaxID=2267611 RepID=A0A5M4B9Z0_9FLAO|nr:hypothetical protein RCZ01_17150 [Capnocytophaga felis]GET48302.1 hypothetical protein RCZ02_11330 [Capnocytophaga felis]
MRKSVKIFRLLCEKLYISKKYFAPTLKTYVLDELRCTLVLKTNILAKKPPSKEPKPQCFKLLFKKSLNKFYVFYGK